MTRSSRAPLQVLRARQPAVLARAVAAAEQLLFDLGFLQFRVRCHGDIARIEVLPAQLPKLVENREAVIARFHALGFRYVTMDLEGFRSGSMDGK